MTGDIDLKAAIVLLGILGFPMKKAVGMLSKDVKKVTTLLRERKLLETRRAVSIKLLDEHDPECTLPLYYRDLTVVRYLRVVVVIGCFSALIGVVFIVLPGVNQSLVSKESFVTGLIFTLVTAAIHSLLLAYIERTYTRAEDACR